MSYPLNTTLTRKDPFTDEARAHLNHLRVVAVSPISAPSAGEWAGSASGDMLVCTPVDTFGDNEIVPVAILNRDYAVEFMPEEPAQVVTNQRQVRPQRQESPAEYFDRVAAEKAQAEAKAAKPKKAPA